MVINELWKLRAFVFYYTRIVFGNITFVEVTFLTCVDYGLQARERSLHKCLSYTRKSAYLPTDANIVNCG